VEALLAILLAFLPPCVMAAFPPRTEKWRRARKLFWIATALGIITLAATVVVIEVIGRAAFFLGPAILWIGALLINATALAVWCYAVGTIRSEWSEWRKHKKRHETVVGVPGVDPTKPWKM
jgi:hypothetical protein